MPFIELKRQIIIAVEQMLSEIELHGSDLPPTDQEIERYGEFSQLYDKLQHNHKLTGHDLVLMSEAYTKYGTANRN